MEWEDKGGYVNSRCTLATLLVLAVGLHVSSAWASDNSLPAKKTKTAAAKKTKTLHSPGLQEQIDSLRKELETQSSLIESLKIGMATKDSDLKQARQAAAEAQAAADRVAEAVSIQQQATIQNAGAVDTLQNTVDDLKGNQTSFGATVSNETAKMKKAINNPAAFHYKGITLSPYGFFNGETYFRTHATGGEEATPWSSIPYTGADSYSMSEMGISGRQSRVGFILDGKVPWGTVRATFEGDFFGSGTTSNANQSSSYVFRQRIASVETETKGRWNVSGGQGWTLASEDKVGINGAPSNRALPSMIDPNYVAGLVWARMGFIRLTKSFSKVAFAVSAENPQLLYAATLAGNTPYAVLGSAGLNASALNQAISDCSPSTTVVNYTSQADGAIPIAVPVYKTVNSCTSLANISFNKAPDFLAKVAFDPVWGHYELFGIGRMFQETIYPGETTNANLYGGLTDINTGTVLTPALSTMGAYPNKAFFGGVGGSLRVSVIKNQVTFGAKVLGGPGVGHFSASALSDATTNQRGGLEPIHNLSGLMTLEIAPTPRLQLYSYYGGDYAGREDFAVNPSGGFGLTQSIASTPYFCPNIADAFACTTAPTAANLATGGKWGPHYTFNSTPVAVGYGSRYLNNSACNAVAAPGYNGASTGYYAGGSCGAQTRDVQEITGGYWYDLYKGDRGRLRQGLQYSYVVREGWSGASGIGAKGIEDMVFASLRYFLP